MKSQIGSFQSECKDFNTIVNKYGHFEVDSGEFVITDLLTPRPWANVMSNGRYGLVISHTGGGFSWSDNCQLQRITRWEQDLAQDLYGRWLYVHNEATGETRSTTFNPIKSDAQEEEVRHGLGYTVFRRKWADLATEQTVFVPQNVACEHQIVAITNPSDKPMAVVVGSYLEWLLGAQGEWHREFHRLFMSVSAIGNTFLAWKRTGLDEGTRVAPSAPMTAYVTVVGLEGVEWFADKAQWLGRRGDVAAPEGLTSPVQPTITERWDDPIAACRARVVLAPGATIRFALTIGVEANRSEAQVSASATLEEIDARLAAIKTYYQERSGALAISTDDPAFDLMNNTWLPFQAETGRMVARCAYYQQGGAYGYRDQLQDSLSLLESDPARTLHQLELHAEAMYEDGGVRHWWHPNSDIAADSHHSDTCLWLAFGTLEYLDETADFGALEKPLRYLNRETKKFGRTGSLLEHCLTGIERMLARRSPSGMPLIGAGDWNDGLSHAGIDGKGESVWLAMFGYGILTRMANVLDRVGEIAKATRFRNEAALLQKAVETHAWDGAWYVAGTSDNGQHFGSRANAEGSIFLNPQTWSVITGIGSSERAQSALGAVREHLVKPYGALLLAPAYRTVDPYVGYITRYAPGLRENGGVYSHASTWAVQAFAQSGDIETAYAIYQGMMPPVRAALDADSYQAEPFVMPGNVDGPDSPFEGRAGWTWYTGSAAWMRRTACNWILGVRATLDGLQIQPNLPRALGTARLRRPFRGDIFEIEIEPGDAHDLYVDGVLHDGSVLTPSGENRVRKVRAQSRS